MAKESTQQAQIYDFESLKRSVHPRYVSKLQREMAQLLSKTQLGGQSTPKLSEEELVDAKTSKDVSLNTEPQETAVPDALTQGEYMFPEVDLYFYRSLSTQEILAELQDEFGTYGAAPRERFCALNLILNERRVAPSLRSIPHRITRHKGLPDDQKLESNDRQVIDAHWLHQHHRTASSPKDMKVKRLMSGSNFDFSLASEIVRVYGTAARKASLFKLPPVIQAELLTIRTKEVTDRWKEIQAKVDAVEILLLGKAREPKSRLDSNNIPERVDEYLCLALGKRSPKAAANWWSLLHGIAETDALVDKLRKRRDWFEASGYTFS